MKLSIEKYKDSIESAINHFWDVRNTQLSSKTTSDTGNRGAVTGGKQLEVLLIYGLLLEKMHFQIKWLLG